MATKRVRVQNKRFGEASGVDVYCVHKNNDVDNYPYSYWYTFVKDTADENHGAFDIRELVQPIACATSYTAKEIRATIDQSKEGKLLFIGLALDLGMLKSEMNVAAAANGGRE